MIERLKERRPDARGVILTGYGNTFLYTTVGTELRAWSIPAGTPAPKAAGKIHSDMERGFIRAEVVHFNDFAAAGSMAKAKEHGHLRLEGKEYVVQDGDILLFRFNV